MCKLYIWWDSKYANIVFSNATCNILQQQMQVAPTIGGSKIGVLIEGIERFTKDALLGSPLDCDGGSDLALLMGAKWNKTIDCYLQRHDNGHQPNFHQFKVQSFTQWKSGILGNQQHHNGMLTFQWSSMTLEQALKRQG